VRDGTEETREPGPAGSDRSARPAPATPLSELQVLQGVSRAFGSTPDVDEAAEAAVRWARAAVGGDDEAVVRLFLADASGALYPVVPRLDAADAPEQRAARRRILENRRAVRVPLSGGRTMVSFPLVSRGESVGVLEVVAAAAALEERWATLDAVASQVAIVFRNLHHRASLHSSFEGLKHMSELAGEMVRARTPEEAVRAAVRFCHERFGSPAAGWITGADPTRLVLVSGRGLGTGRGAELRSRMRRIHRDDVRTETSRRALADRFADLAGEGTAKAVPAGEALLLVAGSASTTSFRLVEDLLEDVLNHLAVVSDAERRTEGLDLGLALTAHEVRGPLVGALAIIERLILERDEEVEERSLLHRSREQLQQLVALVDGMLRWAVAGEPLGLMPANLVTVVREAAEALSQETSQGRVKVTGTRSVQVRADTDHLRSAVSNVIRNALAYSPAETTVTVTVQATDGRATVTVGDQGPGVPSAEQDSIFDPFMRGSAAQLVRSGNGLGLFIARRVMEAHGGRIWLGSPRTGSMFHLEMPLVEGVRAR
jgi:signal transduction histidine kinase